MRLTRFLRRARWDEERARELESYLAEEIADNLARGMPPDAARTAAYRKLGNPTRIREEIYTMNSLAVLETLWEDLRYGARLLRRNPTFAIVAILTLALGTGANTAIFQLVDAVRLRTLPVDHPEQLVEVRIVKSPNGRTGTFNGRWPMLSYPLYLKVRDRQQVFSGFMAWGSTSFDLAQGGEQRPAQAFWVSGNYFDVLGVRPAAGRLFGPSDDVRGCRGVAVLGYAFWQREYGGDPSVVGRSVVLDGHPFDVVGVTSREFYGVDVGHSFDVAVPICAEPILAGERTGLDKPDTWFLGGLGRLKPGMTLEQAGAQLAGLSPAILAETVSPRYSAADARDYREMVIGARPAASGISDLRRTYSDSLTILLGVTGIVLLIACANLANLMFARATVREREVAVRLAIGASRRRVIRQLLSESVLIAAMGAAAGIVAAQWFSRFLVAFLNSDVNPLFVDLALDWRVFAFAAGIAGAACVVFGLAPALRATQTSLGAAMKAGARGSTDGRARFGLRRALVVVQVALSLVLVVGALLFARSLRNLTTLDPGFRSNCVLAAELDLRKADVPETARPAFNRRVIEALGAVPGVRAVAQAFTTPVGGNFWNNRIVIGGIVQQGQTNFNEVGPGYFNVLGIRLVSGRDFNEHDTPQSVPVAIVSESGARLFGGRSPLGQSFQVEGDPGKPQTPFQIVGVVADTKYSDLREPFEPLVYLAATQETQPSPSLRIVLRTDADMSATTAAATRAIAGVHPAIAIQYQEVRGQLARSLTRERLMATLSGFFGGLAVAIATIGLYGLMSYMVTRRRVEIGVRMALGADAPTIVRMIVREAGVLLLAGLVLGGIVSVYAARAANTFLYGLQPGDPTTLALAMAALVFVTLLASWIPATRASRVEPTVALREE